MYDIYFYVSYVLYLQYIEYRYIYNKIINLD